jgi:hypothetical protein
MQPAAQLASVELPAPSAHVALRPDDWHRPSMLRVETV